MSVVPARKNFRAVFLCMMAVLCMSGLLAPFAGATDSPGKTLPLYSKPRRFSNQLTTLDPLTDTVLTISDNDDIGRYREFGEWHGSRPAIRKAVCDALPWREPDRAGTRDGGSHNGSGNQSR